MRAFDVETGERLVEPLRVVGRVLDRDFLFTATDVADGVDPDRDPSADTRDVLRPRERGAAAPCRKTTGVRGVVSRPPVRACRTEMRGDVEGLRRFRPQLLPEVVFRVAESLLLGGALPLAEVHSFFHGTGVP